MFTRPDRGGDSEAGGREGRGGEGGFWFPQPYPCTCTLSPPHSPPCSALLAPVGTLLFFFNPYLLPHTSYRSSPAATCPPPPACCLSRPDALLASAGLPPSPPPAAPPFLTAAASPMPGRASTAAPAAFKALLLPLPTPPLPTALATAAGERCAEEEGEARAGCSLPAAAVGSTGAVDGSALLSRVEGTRPEEDLLLGRAGPSAGGAMCTPIPLTA